MNFFVKYKKHLKNILYSLITYISILIYFNYLFKSASYNILITLLYFLILLFYYKIDMSNDIRIKKFSYILSFILSCFLSVGNIVYPFVYSGAVNIFSLKNIIYAIVCIIGLFLMLSRIFSLMFLNINKIKIYEDIKDNKKCLKLFFIILGIILICWIPYFLRFYPAIMTPDSYYVIHYANSKILSDFHTFGHTWFFGLPFLLGKLLFANMNIAVAFSIVFQMIIMAVVFAYSVIYLYKNGLKKFICILCTLVYALSPLYAHYSITLWRDVIFGGAFVLLFISLLQLLYNKNNSKKFPLVLLIISTLLILFFRNNGIYICILLLPFILLSKISHKKLVTIIYISILIFYYIIKGPIFNYFNVQKSKTIEAYSIPLQQIARTIAMGKDLDEESKNYLSEIMKVDLISKNYSSATSDPIKNITDNKKLSETKLMFFKIWFKNLFRYPKVYIEAYLTQTLGYWYPNVEYWATGSESKSFFKDVDVYSDPITPNQFNKIIDITSSRKIPFCNLIWSVGTATFILIISTFIFIYNNKFKYLLCYTPLYLLLFSILIATPVFCELRYVYGIFTCIPLLLTIPFKKGENND